jgi:plasmid stabilization system protein ParE
MLYTIITTANSRADVQDAIDWENSREAGLANQFLKDLEQKLSAISRTPHMGAIRYENVRCVTTKIFSYLIHYTVDETQENIYILRILHTSRKPIW